jgi:glyoxylase-like metal-dependent hydrolase (beta-lactamase superfamily II)
MDAGLVRELDLAGIDSRIRGFSCGDIVDSYAILAQRLTVLVDTLISPETARALMERLGPRPAALLIVNTHGDWDHVWGNCLFAGEGAVYPAPVIAHALAGERMTSPAALSYLRQSQRETPERYSKVILERPSIGIAGACTVNGGDLSLELVETPGHSPDHLAIWVPELRLLLAGDAAEMPIPLVPDAESLPTLRTSLEKMAELDPRHVLYCHARGETSPRIIHQNIAYFNELQRRCTEFLKSNSNSTAGDVSVERLAWPLEDVLPNGTSIADLIPDPDFYRRAHRQAVEAMARSIKGERPLAN